MAIVIRAALVADAPAPAALSYASKTYWSYPVEWIRRWEEELVVSSEYIQKNSVFVADKEGEVAGYYAVGWDGEKRLLDILLVDRRYLGRGVGNTLVEQMKSQYKKTQ